MSKRDWSEEKLKVFSFERNVCVSAGAGSGKTAALVELDSRFLSGDTPLGRIDLDQILAITFTEKAAAEMKERIRQDIDERLITEADPLCLDLWTKARRALLSASISTFHSFCARVLRENPLEARLDPRFEVAREEQAREMVWRAARRLIHRSLRAGDPLMQDLILDFTFEGTAFNLIFTLDAVRSTGGDTDTLAERVEEQEKEATVLLDDAKSRLLSLLDDAFALLSEQSVRKSKALGSRLRDLEPSRDSLRSSIAQLSPGGDAEFLNVLHDAFKGAVPRSAQELKEKMKTLIAPDKGEIALLLRFFGALPTQRAMARFIAELDREYAGEKRSMSCVDFEDLLRFCRDLLRDNPEVRRRYKHAYRVILVDEFQDTNELQRQIVYLLAERLERERAFVRGPSIEDVDLEPRKLFVVGDAKQSIYFFRGADVGVFAGVMADVARRGGEIISFQENFRTLDAILDVINPLFAESMQGGPGDFQISFGARDHLVPRRYVPVPCARVEMIFPESEKEEGKRPDAAALREAEADALARRILLITDADKGIDVRARDEDGVEVERRASFGDVALLFRSLTSVKIYEDALRARNIPYYLVKGRGFYGCQEVLDVLQVLRFLAGIQAGVSLAGILRSPLCGCRDDALVRLAVDVKGNPRDLVRRFLGGDLQDIPSPEREKILHCREALLRISALRDRLTLGELMEEVLEAFDFTAVVSATFQGDQKVANLRKLVSLARGFDERGVFAIEDFVRHIEGKVEQESYEAEGRLEEDLGGTVKIMSIHQAKGLEFPVVIVPDLGRSDPVKSPAVHYSPSRGLACRFRDPATGELHDHWFCQAIKQDRTERERAESLRLFYVALTRARDYLILSGSPIRSSEGTWRSLVERFLPKEELENFLSAEEDDAETSFTLHKPEFPRSYFVRLRLVKSSALKPRALRPLPRGVDLVPPIVSPADPGLPREIDKVMKDLSVREALPAKAIISNIFDFKKPQPSVLTLTPTSLMTFGLCPRKYMYDALLSKGEGFQGVLAPEAQSSTLREAQGWAAHRALEEIDFTEGRAVLEEKLERHLFKLGEGQPLLAHKTRPVMEAVLRFIDAPHAKSMGLFEKGALTLREHPFALLVPGVMDVYLKGSMDLAGRNNRGEWFLLDYKYARREEEKCLDYGLQIRTYALALRLGASIGSLRAYLVFLREDPPAFVEVPVGDTALQEFIGRLRAAAREILAAAAAESEDPWERTERRNCESISCRYRMRCW
jgi:ATP-dependent exoDNAse (exonuclease V) beta subunit